mmetsp:Transcript_19619/g.44533  ORF Transcript_19619/g.44533 Transcript_19619/m.44533 type:complete len:244 (-) Transcript_19619:143-874(-)
MAGAAKVIVFGGNGFVGTKVLQALCGRSAVAAVSVSRSGSKPKHLENEAWASKVQWEKGDAMKPETFQNLLEGTTAVVVSIGSPPIPADEAWQTMMNGDSNCSVINAAAAAGVPRLVLVNATTPAWCPSGYAKGKAMAAKCAEEFVGGEASRGALVVKPGAIYGTRHTAGGIPIPLAPLLAPVRFGLNLAPSLVSAATKAVPYLLEGALVPPVSVEALAELAADGCLSGEYGGNLTVKTALEL